MQPPRQIDLSLQPVTRPETWSILRATGPETLKLVRTIAGRKSILGKDPVVLAQNPSAQAGLGHITHMASGFGQIVEPVSEGRLSDGFKGVQLRDCIQLALDEAAIATWLKSVGVRIADTISVSGDGAIEAIVGGEAISCDDAVLTDAEAVLAFGTSKLPKLVEPVWRTTLVTAPVSKLAAPILFTLDHGLLVQQLPGGNLIAFGTGSLELVDAQLKKLIPEATTVGQLSYPSLRTADAAPVVGKLSSSGPTILLGTSLYGAWIVPAIARWLTGRASESEAAWLATHSPVRRGTSKVADIWGAA
jgi:hypothetical protein